MACLAHAAFVTSILASAAASVAATKDYIAPGSSVFSNPLAWSPAGQPSGIDSILLGNSIAADATITIDAGGVVAGTTVNTTRGYTIALTPGGPTVFKAGALNLAAGRLEMAAGGTNTLRASSLTFASTGATLNLHDNSAILDFAFPAPLDAVRTAILTGKLIGDVTDKRRIGYAVASEIGYYTGGTFAGQDVSGANAVLMKVTLAGDSNLDGVVNFDDLVPLAMNWGQTASPKYWREGDFNYDTIVNFDDLVPLAQNYTRIMPPTLTQLASLGGEGFAADWALAQSIVPEPTVALGVAALGLSTIRRRR